MKRTSLFPTSLFLSTLIISSAALAQTPQTSSKPAPAQQKAAPSSTTPTPAPVAEQTGTLDARTSRGLAIQVALDRAGFSPGVIDGAPGTNTTRALSAFREAKGLPAGALNDRADADLGEAFTNPVASYSISADDSAGPFVERIPADMMDKSKLSTLAYASMLELLAERFHSSPKLLQRLNPSAKFEQGEVIVVPNVEPFIAPGVKSARQQTSAGPSTKTHTDAAPAMASGAPVKGEATRATRTDATRGGMATKAAKPAPGDFTVTVTDSTKTLQVQNAAGEIIFHAPVTVGSKNDPLPVGEWKVNGVSPNPTFNYNPDLFWDADPSHAKAKIPAGPNNPVGVVWIDLSKEHYGIHGTPEPSRIGYTESHGCIRLTNWDAIRLAALVRPGTKVVLR